MILWDWRKNVLITFIPNEENIPANKSQKFGTRLQLLRSRTRRKIPTFWKINQVRLHALSRKGLIITTGRTGGYDLFYFLFSICFWNALSYFAVAIIKWRNFIPTAIHRKCLTKRLLELFQIIQIIKSVDRQVFNTADSHFVSVKRTKIKFACFCPIRIRYRLFKSINITWIYAAYIWVRWKMLLCSIIAKLKLLINISLRIEGFALQV